MSKTKDAALRHLSSWIVSSFITVLVMVVVVAISEALVRHDSRLLVLPRDQWECADKEPDGCAVWQRRGLVHVLPQSAQR